MAPNQSYWPREKEWGEGEIYLMLWSAISSLKKATSCQKQNEAGELGRAIIFLWDIKVYG